MKVSIDTKLYAVMNSKTKELVSRYTGGFFWTRRGDAVNKLNEKMRFTFNTLVMYEKYGWQYNNYGYE